MQIYQNKLESTSQFEKPLKKISNYPVHPFHMTAPSAWPFLASWSVFAILSSAALYFNNVSAGINLTLAIVSVTCVFILWFRDIVIEATYIGLHTRIVQESLRLGVTLFIVTEAILFFSVFWAYFHSSLSPTIELGTEWCPAGVIPLSPLALPLLNTLLLVSSGATVTYAHHAIIEKNRQRSLKGIVYTILLATIFTYFQYLEYDAASFSLTDGAYGSCFYFSTGLHGLHVIVGTLFLATGFLRLAQYHYTTDHHLGLESAILYWHFVDVVWLFLYLSVYWWGSDLL